MTTKYDLHIGTCASQGFTVPKGSTTQYFPYVSNTKISFYFQPGAATAAPTQPTIVGAAVATRDLSTLVAAVKAAGLVATLSGPGPFTVFAPTNAAFAAIGKDTLATLLKPENKQKLVDILEYHVVKGSVVAADLSDGQTVTTLEGQDLIFTVDPGYVGVSNDDGTEAEVVKADIKVSNGVVHVIDQVLLPPGFEVPTAAATLPNIVGTAVATTDLSTLVAAVKAAGLVATLSSPGPFTVFAPTNTAFAKIQPVVTKLLLPKNKALLAKLLTYHVLAGKVMAAAISNGQSVATVEGQKICFEVNARTKAVGIYECSSTDDAVRVIKANVVASNGVVHVIDSVLVPPGFLALVK